MNFPLYLKIEQKQTNKQTKYFSTARKWLREMHCINENWEYIKKRKKVLLHLGWRKGQIFGLTFWIAKSNRYQCIGWVTWDVDLLLGFDLIPP